MVTVSIRTAEFNGQDYVGGTSLICDPCHTQLRRLIGRLGRRSGWGGAGPPPAALVFTSAIGLAEIAQPATARPGRQGAQAQPAQAHDREPVHA